MSKRIWTIVMGVGLLLCGIWHAPTSAQPSPLKSGSVREIFDEAQRYHLGTDRPVDYRQAYTLYQEVVKRDPQYKDAYYHMAHISFAQKRYDLAAEYYQRVLRLNPQDADAQNNLGAVYQFQGKTEEAKMAYQRALSLNPKLAQTYYNLAFIFFKEGEKEKAAKAADQALALEPDNQDFVRLAANIKGNMGKLDGTIFMVLGGLLILVAGCFLLFRRRGR